jgi:hypothetical protein
MREWSPAVLLCVVVCAPLVRGVVACTPHTAAEVVQPAAARSADTPIVAPPDVVAAADAPQLYLRGDELADEPALVREPEAAGSDAPGEVEPELTVSPTGLGMVELKLGAGADAKEGDRVTVHYVGKLDSGEEFDSSRQRDRPFTFELASGLVIAGWDEGVVGMRVGGLRRLLIPPTLAYGSRGAPPAIPPNAILEFEIELLAIEPAP